MPAHKIVYMGVAHVPEGRRVFADLSVYQNLKMGAYTRKVKEEIERYSVIRTVTAVERADVVIVMIDASEGVTEQDAKIAGIAHERGKGVIIAVNKWDAIEKNDKTIYKHTNRIREVLAYMPYAELVFISAKTGLRISRMFETIDAVIENQTLRIQTGVLNEILSEAVAMQQPPSDKGTSEDLLYDTGSCQTAYICYLCK